MYKSAIALTSLLLTGVITVRMMDYQRDPFLQANEAQIEERLKNYECFKQTFDDSLEALADAELSLKQAHAQVNAAARQFYPLYIQYLATVEPGRTDEDRVAHNLVGHIRAMIGKRPELAERVRVLDRELQQFAEK